MLLDESFTKNIQDEIRFFFAINSSKETSSLVVWDAFKAYIRGQIMAYSAKTKRQSTWEQNNIMQQINEIDVKHAHSQGQELIKKSVEL